MDEDRYDGPFPLALYRHDGGEFMMPATHATALLRHVAETFRRWRVRGEVQLDLETTARLYHSLVQYAADLDAVIAAAGTRGHPGVGGERAAADEFARYLAEVADAFLAAGEPGGPTRPTAA